MPIKPLENKNQLRPDAQITVYASEDHVIKRASYESDADWQLALRRFGKTSQKDKAEVVVVPKGTAEKVYRVDARERLERGWRTYPPGKEPPQSGVRHHTFRLSQIKGIGKQTADRLNNAGWGVVDRWLEEGALERIQEEVGGVGTKYLQKIHEYIVERYGHGIKDADADEVNDLDDDLGGGDE